MTAPPIAFADFVVARGPSLVRLATAVRGDSSSSQVLVAQELGRAWDRWQRVGWSPDPSGELRRRVLRRQLRLGLREPAGDPWRRLLETAPRRGGPRQPATGRPEPTDGAIAVLTHRLQLLSPHERAVLVLRHLENLSDAQVADVLGTDAGELRRLSAHARTGLGEVSGTAREDGDLRAAVLELSRASGPPRDLLPGARAYGEARRSARRRVLAAAVGVAVLAAAVLGSSGAAEPGPSGPDRAVTVSDAEPELPAGYRWVSAYGVELAAPSSWRLAPGDGDCRRTGERVVVLGCPYPGAGTDRVQLLVGDEVDKLRDQGGAETQVGGRRAVATERAGALDLRVVDPRPGLPALGIVITTDDEQVRQTVRDSVALPEVDHAGCETTAPAVDPPAGPASALLFDDLSTVSLCVYDSRTGLLLGSRGFMLLAEGSRLLTLLRDGATGDLPACEGPPTASEGWVHLVAADGATADVATTACGLGRERGVPYLTGSDALAEQFAPVAVGAAPG